MQTIATKPQPLAPTETLCPHALGELKHECSAFESERSAFVLAWGILKMKTPKEEDKPREGESLAAVAASARALFERVVEALEGYISFCSRSPAVLRAVVKKADSAAESCTLNRLLSFWLLDQINQEERKCLMWYWVRAGPLLESLDSLAEAHDAVRFVLKLASDIVAHAEADFAKVQNALKPRYSRALRACEQLRSEGAGKEGPDISGAFAGRMDCMEAFCYGKEGSEEHLPRGRAAEE